MKQEKEIKIKATGQVEAEVKDNPVEPTLKDKLDGYDGADMVAKAYTNEQGKAAETSVKVMSQLSTEEAIKWLGGKHPADYFKDGKIAKSFSKEIGVSAQDFPMVDEFYPRLLSIYESLYGTDSDCLLFIHPTTKRVSIIYPKSKSGFEKDEKGEYIDVNTVDMASIVFSSVIPNSPDMYEPEYFKKELTKIKNIKDSLIKVAQ